VAGASHGPDQALRRLRAEIEPGGGPLRQTATAIGGGHLTGVELFEDGHVHSGETGPQRLVREQLLFQLVSSPLSVTHTCEHTFALRQIQGVRPPDPKIFLVNLGSGRLER